MKSKSLFISILSLGLMLAGVQAQASAHLDDADVSQLQPYYVKEGLDLSIYDSVLLNSLKVGDTKVMPPPWIEGEARNPEKWQLTASDEKFLRQSYAAAMRTELADNGGYEIVTESGAGVLVLDVAIITLTPYARKNEKATVKGFGELLTQAQLRDGSSGELLAVFEGVQTVGSEYQQNTRLNAETSLQTLFELWGKRVRGMLDRSR